MSLRDEVIEAAKKEMGSTEGCKVYYVELEGKPPGLLMHNPEFSMDSKKDKHGATIIPPPEEEAKLGRYLSDDGTELVVPSRLLHASMIRGSSAFKYGKKSLTPYIAGGVQLHPMNMLLGRKADDYEINRQRVVIQKSGILRARPLLKEWNLHGIISFKPSDVPASVNDVMFRNILYESGTRIGLGDFRPEKRGPYGRFEVKILDEVKG